MEDASDEEQWISQTSLGKVCHLVFLMIMVWTMWVKMRKRTFQWISLKTTLKCWILVKVANILQHSRFVTVKIKKFKQELNFYVIKYSLNVIMYQRR